MAAPVRKRSTGQVVGIVIASVVGALLLGGLALAACVAVALGDLNRDLEHASEQGCADSEVPLIAAAAGGNRAGVARQLSKGVDPNRRDQAGNTALNCAVPRNHPAVVATLLKAGANPNSVSRDDDPALVDAARFCQVAAAKLLLDAGADPAKVGNGDTALQAAVDVGQARMVQALLDGGVPTATYGSGRGVGLGASNAESTSTCPSPTRARRAAALGPLLDAGGVDAAVLATAARIGDLGVARAAVAKGARLHGRAGDGVAAEAAYWGDHDLLSLVLAAGAPFDRRSSVATDTGAPVFFDLSGSAELCSDEQPEACDAVAGMAKLNLGSSLGDGATADDSPAALPPGYSATALEQSAWRCDPDAVQVLLDAGADPSRIDAGGFTPLHAAARCPDAKVALVLLGKGATAPKATQEVPLPSSLARKAGDPAVADLLAKAGA